MSSRRHPHPGSRPLARPDTRRGRRLGRALTVLLAAVLALGVLPGSAQAANRATPRNFTGYGFDQCVTPTQSAMDAWLRSSPFWAVGIYISGASRGCRTQPNQTATWVETQLRNGWRILPITLGPQASCNPSFPRYGNDPRVVSTSTNQYAAARRQGREEAVDAVAAARRLGIAPGSTLWYDMEAYDISNTSCRESALAFTAAWTNKLHGLDYVSGVYSSAASHIKALDDVRATRPGAWTLPDQIWIARWDGLANTSTSYIRSDGWLPGGRMKQYLGGHNETHGGVTINIDSNWLDLGTGSVARAEKAHCGDVRLNFSSYADLAPGDTGRQVRALQCLLQTWGSYTGPMDGVLDTDVQDAVAAWRSSHGLPAGRGVGNRVWTSLHSSGGVKLVKVGASGERIRRLQRALNASSSSEGLAVDGVFSPAVAAAVKRYQNRLGLTQTGVVTVELWGRLNRGVV